MNEQQRLEGFARLWAENQELRRKLDVAEQELSDYEEALEGAVEELSSLEKQYRFDTYCSMFLECVIICAFIYVLVCR